MCSSANEGKENALALQDRDNAVLSTPTNQVKRAESIVGGNRRPLASKDNNRPQSVLSAKNNILNKNGPGNTLKRPASSLVNTLPENKLKKYGSVLGMTNFMPRAKSLVLRDADEEDVLSEEEDETTLFDEKTKQGLRFQGGLQGLIKKKEDELNIEYAPKRQEELPHVPNGYEPYDKQTIDKLSHFKSPFQVDPVCFETSTEETHLLDLAEPDDIQEPLSDQNLIDLEFDTDNDSGILELSVEYHGEGLNSSELRSLLD